MSIIERVNKLLSEVKENQPKMTSKLQRVLAKSNIEQSIEELSGSTKLDISKEIIEGGRKMIIVANWSSVEKLKNQFVISVREDSVSFIGDNQSNQYLRMEGKEIFDKELTEEYLARTFVNPSTIE
jgi:hypothetical protein